MKRSSWSRLLSLIFAMSLVAAACGGSDSDSGSSDGGTDTTAEETGTDAETTEAGADEGTDEGDEGAMAEGTDLAAVCPETLTIQTDWFPEAEHGSLYQLIGDDYVIDADAQTTTGSLIDQNGESTGIQVQVRAGGPAIGFAAPRAQIYTDDSIHIAYSNLDAQVLAWDATPLIAVMAPLEINPQIIYWDPEAYPEVETLADLKDTGATINIFPGGSFASIFAAEGIWDADQVDPSYDGSPARFVAAGDIAQQGFVSAEPYNYENVFEDWGKPVKYQLLHDAGLQIYSQTLSVKPDRLEELRPCLELFIPIMQHAVVDYAASPDRANAIILDHVNQVDSFWVYSEGLAAYAVETMTELGLHGNGPDSTVGNFDAERIQTLIDQIAATDLDGPDGLTAEEMFTNEFLDESIGF